MRRSVIVSIAAGLILFASNRMLLAAEPAPADASKPAASAANTEQRGAEVKDAIRSGVALLKKEQKSDGSWAYGDSVSANTTLGKTALCTLAILVSEPKAESPELHKALDRLRESTPAFTYAVALQARIFAFDTPSRDLKQVRRLVDWLEEAQVKTGACGGSWNYESPPRDHGDGSNTCFAVLALDAAQRAGVKPKAETWTAIRDYYTKLQNADGSWGYVPTHANGTQTMTPSGIAGLATAEHWLRPADAKPPERLSKPLGAGWAWVDKRVFNAEQMAHSDTQYYWLHALGAALAATETKPPASRQWRAEMTNWLIKRRDAKTGGWQGIGLNKDCAIATSLALIFLGD